MQFENKINLGHLLTALGLLIAGISAYYNVHKDTQANVAKIETQQRELQEIQSRLRLQEINSASHQSSLLNIQTSLTRLETKLDRLSGAN